MGYIDKNSKSNYKGHLTRYYKVVSDKQGNEVIMDPDTGKTYPKPVVTSSERNKHTSIKQLAKPYTTEMMGELLNIVRTAENDNTKLRAIELTLNYAWGKPSPRVDEEEQPNQMVTFTSDQIKFILEQARRSIPEEETDDPPHQVPNHLETLDLEDGEWNSERGDE